MIKVLPACIVASSFARFDLGRSFMHNKDVWQLIKDKLPVSISLGMWTFLISYLVSIPLGIRKAVKDGSKFDTWTSAVIIVGFAIPGFLFAILLLVLFAGGSYWKIFPLRGLTSENWEELSLFGKAIDYLWHITLPVIASVAGSFAVMTALRHRDQTGRGQVIDAIGQGAAPVGAVAANPIRWSSFTASQTR